MFVLDLLLLFLREQQSSKLCWGGYAMQANRVKVAAAALPQLNRIRGESF